MEYKMIGISDERLECELCGKSELKKTVVLEGEDGLVGYYGVCCAAMLLRIPSDEVKDMMQAEKIKMCRKYFSDMFFGMVNNFCWSYSATNTEQVYVEVKKKQHKLVSIFSDAMWHWGNDKMIVRLYNKATAGL